MDVKKSFSVNLAIGDGDFPLEINTKHDIKRRHALVGQPARVSQFAKMSLRPLQGKKGSITGVLKKQGVIVGYEVKINGNPVYGPKKDFYIGRQMLEDIHIQSHKALQIQEVLRHYREQHDYYGTSWDGVEKFYYMLAKVADQAHIESVGWFKYPSSSRKGMDGKNWRVLVPDEKGYVVINCHSMLHDEVWTLATTIYSTNEIVRNDLPMIEGKGHWDKTLRWTLKTAEVLECDGCRYKAFKTLLKDRLKANKTLETEAKQQLKDVIQAFKAVTGKKPKLPPYSIGFSDIRVAPESIGVHEPPTDLQRCSIITIDPCVIGHDEYVKYIVQHELIHYLLETQCSDETHSQEFHDIADKVGLPTKYRF